MQWQNIEWIWLVFGLVLIALELILPGGIVLFVGLSALLVAGLLFVGLIDGWMMACTTWFIGSIALVFAFRGLVQKVVGAEVERTNTDEDLDAYNQIALVCERIPAQGAGRIRFRGSEWSARGYPGDQDLEVGTSVRIVLRENLTWVVEAIDPSHETPQQEPQ